jgi:hypothetical protein
MNSSGELGEFGSNTDWYVKHLQKKRETQDKEHAEEELKKEIFAKIGNEITNAKIEIASEVVKPIERDIQDIKTNYLHKKDFEDKIVTRSEIAEVLVNALTHVEEKIEDKKIKNIILKLLEALKNG